MKSAITFIILFATGIVFSQVGINTNLPDPSAMLDISSDDKGLLVPRMTTAERLLITAPADGLMVYDTDLQDFKYYRSGEWNYIGRSQIRENYKLVKDISDLSDELIAGSGSQYLLNTDFLYEINGSVTFDFPINLNGAYVEGVDSGEDVIINASGAAFFQGTSGGSLRNLTVSGNGNPIFDITGSGSELLVSNNTIYLGASAVGTLDSLGTVFFSISQFVGNTDGLAVSNMSTFLMSNVFWTASNTGTFIAFSGTFNNLQMSSGRIEADTGEVGVDVSANPTINNDATLSQLSFVGSGMHVNPYTVGTYTGFNFTKHWNVNCSGLPVETDQVSVADINFNFTAGGGAGTTFGSVSNGTPIKLAGATTSNNLFRFSSSGNNRVVYEGKKKRFFNVSSSVSFEGSTPGDRYIFYIARGRAGDPTPTVIDATGVWKVVNNAASVPPSTTVRDISAVPIVGVFDLEPNDYIEVWVERFSGTGQIFTVALNLAIN
ncbi:hypothetical protein LY01_00115 [Nonlabens xylanidelens]|uniref:Cell wall anchor protein n=1 Tax=Nonlabens xylanidelens TaxID=191564 RepID=A0A2S6IPW9_9FLAO|nr:cell wall anchor protein [Nonlabens xylanidelens]PPK96297.1 hypothetical protein LY01_00115 [Nonlabens xylanidelens]PQJ18028.1 cell wall anchor protein [Nonlabens xylanidelens]